jgi:2-polyprenyl-3-methyl-5-hydroxy-6-metoxy-1,4-benzoquinol methylase
MTDLNPQARQMADESMVRGLRAQAQAIWPQEVPLIRRYALPAEARILDAGCGTGEITSRLAELFPQARVLGVDIIDSHLELARSRYRELAPRLAFEHQSIFESNVRRFKPIPRVRSAASSGGVKCSPAVGAATAPSFCANMVW